MVGPRGGASLHKFFLSTSRGYSTFYLLPECPILLFLFLCDQIRDLVSWCIDMSRTISSGEPVHDVTDAETLLRRIDEYRSEMDAREEGFNKVMETGEMMIDNGHFAADEVAMTSH